MDNVVDEETVDEAENAAEEEVTEEADKAEGVHDEADGEEKVEEEVEDEKEEIDEEEATKDVEEAAGEAENWRARVVRHYALIIATQKRSGDRKKVVFSHGLTSMGAGGCECIRG